MKENILKIILDNPVEEVFEFTVNPSNTHKWIPFIIEEKTSEYPPKIGTIYVNKSDNELSEYEVINIMKNEIFVLKNINNDYFVEYKYIEIDKNKTELIYREWVENGELDDVFTQDVLDNIKKQINN